MKIELTKKPKNAILIEGFPGFGLIGTIVTEFLIEHLDAKSIGKIVSDEMPPVIAVHDSKLIEPLEVFYSDKENIMILHSLTGVSGLEWKMAEAIGQLCNDLEIKEVICVEGVNAENLQGEAKTFYVSSNKKKMEELGIGPLKEGIIIGVTGALLLRLKDINKSCIFVETHSSLPDSRGAAKVIEILDKYLNLNVDYNPLLKKAEVFERKVKQILEKGHDALTKKQERDETLNYLG